MDIDWTKIWQTLLIANRTRSPACIRPIAAELAQAIYVLLASFGRGYWWFSSEVDDLAQNSWIEVYEKANGRKNGDFIDVDHVARYVARVCRHRIQDMAERKRRQTCRLTNMDAEADDSDRSRENWRRLNEIHDAVASCFGEDWVDRYFFIKMRIRTQIELALDIGMPRATMSDKISEINDWIRERFHEGESRIETPETRTREPT